MGYSKENFQKIEFEIEEASASFYFLISPFSTSKKKT